MITFTVVAILGVLLVIVLMNLFKKDPKPLPAPIRPVEDLANLKVTDARTGDVLSIAGAGDQMSDLDFTVDRNPFKHGLYTPGMHIPIYPVSAIDEARPDYLLIMPWNLKNEIISQMRHVSGWGCKFIVPIPSVDVIDPRELVS